MISVDISFHVGTNNTGGARVIKTFFVAAAQVCAGTVTLLECQGDYSYADQESWLPTVGYRRVRIIQANKRRRPTSHTVIFCMTFSVIETPVSYLTKH